MEHDAFDRLNEQVSTEQVEAQVSEGEEIFHHLLEHTRAALRAEQSGDFAEFVAQGLAAANITADLTSDQLMTVMLGAISVIAREAEGL